MVRCGHNSMALRMVVRSISKIEREKVIMKEDLKKMECHKLLEQP